MKRNNNEDDVLQVGDNISHNYTTSKPGSLGLAGAALAGVLGTGGLGLAAFLGSQFLSGAKPDTIYNKPTEVIMPEDRDTNTRFRLEFDQ